MKTQNKRLLIIICVVFAVLSIPLLAMQFTHEVNWNLSDFVIMAILLLGTGLACELVIRKVPKMQHRILLCAVLLIVLLLVWAELAVGLFGTPFAGS